uniref:Uncharacterized protein n=1 Tax=Angomonas deanei TaxID=59799 RepID=C6K3U4_9TRYP|nr:conserved hypothetical protein [Angomonas deanei]
MLQLPTLSTSPSGNGSTVITPVTQPTTPLSASTASSGSRSSKSGRSKRGGSSVARRRVRRVLDNTQKHYAPHICRFSPYRPPSAAVLDPFPNLRINSLCMAGLSSLVTVHRSGLRLYRERHLGIPAAGSGGSNYSNGNALTSFPAASVHGLPAQRTPTSSTVPVLPGVSTASGVFELLETRTDFQVRESYLCTSMQPVLIDDAVLVSKWSRYFCVASGSDRVVHSVSVMSSGAHFCLHHEKHQGNKVVCLHCTQMATEPFHPTSLRPAVVSVDEVGGVVLFDVEREVAVVLEKAPLWFRQSTGAEWKDTKTTTATEVTDDTAAAAADNTAGDTKATPPPQQQTSLLAHHLSPDEEDHVVDAMEKVPLKERSPYHLEHGVATRVTLVGPCLELCNHCHNAFMSLHASRGYTLISLYICSRAQDLPTTAPADGSSPNTAAAELNVTLLRVLWGPRRAFVLEEVQLVREAAPTDVCEAGVATAARPYQVALPMTVLLARPALQLWQLCACTGEHLDTRSLYQTSALTKKSVRRGGYGGGQPRAASEFVIHWVPLGRHQLTVVQDDRAGPQSWFCIAAVTDDDTVLLLGRDPQSLRTPSPFTNVVVSDATIAPLRATEAEAEKFRDADLEGWLDDLHTSPAPSPVPEMRAKDVSSADTPAIVVESVAPPAATPAVVAGGGSAASASTPYTVLMVLYSPRGHSLGKANGDAAAPSVAAGVLSIMPDLRDNRLLLFMADEEALLSVPLPFAGAMPTVTDKDQPGDSIDVRSGGTVLRGGSSSPSAVAGAVAAAAGADEQNSSAAAAGGGGGGGYSQYLWGATSKAVTAASQGWSTSMQRWAPSTTSYFSFSGSPVTSSAPVQSLSGNTQPTQQQTPPCSSSPPQQPQQKNAMVESPPPTSGEVPAVRPPSVQQAPVAASTVADSFRSFSIARPLMAAVFHFTGEDQEPPAAAAVGPTTTPQKVCADEPHHAPPPQRQQQQKAVEEGKEHLSLPTAASLRKSPMPAPAVSVVPLPSNEHSFHSADVRSSSEASTARTAASLAVPIRVARSSTRERSGSRALSSAGSQHSEHQRRSHHQHHNRHPRSHFHSSQSAPSLPEDDTTATVSLSVYEGAHGGSKSRRRRDRQSVASSEASPSPPSSLPHTVTLEDGSAAAAAIRASYMESQMQLLMQEADLVPELGGNGDRNSATAATEEPACRCRTFEEAQYELRRLVDVEEPLERNMIQYSWKDGHNDLYIRLSVEQDSLDQAEQQQQQQQRGSRRPVEFSTSHDAPLRLVTNTSADVADGVHSVGFLSTYHSVVAWRAETASYGNCFAFADYFRTLQVPQHVLDVQERDKCRLELEDLRLQQAKDMTAVHPYELMSVCQNEERRSSEDAWKLHATFPFDDERDGRVVDLHWLNRTAGSTAASPTPEWRWATEREVRLWAEEEGSAQSRTKRVQSLVRELKDWTVGPWEYAERWPSREESSGKSGTAGLAFKWSPAEAAVHRCRRRRLTRLRVNVPELRRQTDLTDAHIRELGALRDELGL